MNNVALSIHMQVKTSGRMFSFFLCRDPGMELLGCTATLYFAFQETAPLVFKMAARVSSLTSRGRGSSFARVPAKRVIVFLIIDILVGG